MAGDALVRTRKVKRVVITLVAVATTFLLVLIGFGVWGFYLNGLDEQMVGAGERGDVGAARHLLASGVSVDAPFEDGTTSLMLAVGNKHVDMVRFLLANGADPSKQNDHGDSVLSYAHDPVIRKVIEDAIRAKRH